MADSLSLSLIISHYYTFSAILRQLVNLLNIIDLNFAGYIQHCLYNMPSTEHLSSIESGLDMALAS